MFFDPLGRRVVRGSAGLAGARGRAGQSWFQAAAGLRAGE